jgi:Tol biopolymer transport system component
MTRRNAGSVLVAAVALLAVATSPTAASGSASAESLIGATARVSVSSTGAQANGASYGDFGTTVSANGRFVAFESAGSNLVRDDTNGLLDVFVRDLRTGRTRRMSLGRAGAESNGGSYGPAISANGRFVVFDSDATNLVTGDTNGFTDLFVRDRWRGTTRRVSTRRHGTQADGFSDGPAISADGRFVAFRSDASNLVRDDTNGLPDVFVRDLWKRTTRGISVGRQYFDGASSPPAISANGRFIAFDSDRSDVPGDANAALDVFVRDRWTGTTRLVSVGSDGFALPYDSYAPAISADGRFVAFRSDAANLSDTIDPGLQVDILLRDRRAGVTTPVSVGTDGTEPPGRSGGPSLSGNGRFVAWSSDATNLLPGDATGSEGVFLQDRWTGVTALVAARGNGGSDAPAISANGRVVAFTSDATNLVAGDANHTSDVFVYRR